jgi:hypothetical protein
MAEGQMTVERDRIDRHIEPSVFSLGSALARRPHAPRRTALLIALHTAPQRPCGPGADVSRPSRGPLLSKGLAILGLSCPFSIGEGCLVFTQNAQLPSTVAP